MRSRVGALDGIRGLALVAVLGYHVTPGVFPGGFLGVEMFFVLSGFLLTSLLLGEHRRTGRIDHRSYALRRVMRLVPAALVVLTALLLFVPLVAGSDAHRLKGDLLSSVAGVTNWHLIADGSSYFDRLGRPPFVRHFWSLAAEIQFCVICSVLAAWLAKKSRRFAIGVVGGTVLGATLWMAFLYRSPDPSRAYYGTDARLGALMGGVLLAVVLATGPAETLRSVARRSAVPAIFLFVLLVALANETSRFVYPVGFLLAQGATATLIVAGLGDGVLARWLEARPATWLGERSYGIYLWHWPIVALMRPGAEGGWHPAPAALVSIAAATVLGDISYRFVEIRAMRTARTGGLRALLPSWDFRRRALAASAALTLFFGLVLLGVRLPTADPIAESLRAGEKVLAAQLSPSPDATKAATAAPAVRSDQARLASARHPAPEPRPAPLPALGNFQPGSISVTAIGDSVMVGAAPLLHAKLGPSGYIDAVKNRRFSEAAGIARSLREQGRLGRVVIVHLGNNGPVRNEDVDAFMAEMVDVDHVLVVTVRVAKPWEGPVNDTLRAAKDRHARIVLVDWHAHSEGHPDWFYDDGTHLTKAGAENYSNLLTGSIPPPPTPPPTPKPTPKPTPTPEGIPLPTVLPPRS